MALDNGLAVIGWITCRIFHVKTREELYAALEAAYPDEKARRSRIGKSALPLPT